MKQSMALIFNDMHVDQEVLEVNHQWRHDQLIEVIEGVLPMTTYWHECLLAMDISDRARMDIGNAYYGLPAPDCDFRALHRRASDFMAQARKVDREMWDDLMLYM